MMLNAVSRYWHTLRHLKPVQFYGRLWFRWYQPRPNLRGAPQLRELAGWQLPSRRAPSLLGPEEFVFLNETGQLADIGWTGDGPSKLWRYNQHYFDDLNAEGADARSEWHRALLARWVADNPPGQGDGWEPYPTSLRIVNWIKWALAGNGLSSAAIASLAVQVRWLAARLEWHLLGNHLLANAKALVFAGVFFEGEEAQRWYRRGKGIFLAQLKEQVLPDGGHFELSPMYHNIVLEDLLDVINVMAACGSSPDGELLDCVGRMLRWSAVMRHGDGGIPFFNDGALGIAAGFSELAAYGERLGVAQDWEDGSPFHWLKDSGYIRSDKGPSRLFVDVAEVGPSYLPGHAHADTLSLEFSLGGQRVFVNAGTSLYGVSEERLRQRGTASHNTVTVNGENSSEVWSGFRVARRAHPRDLVVDEDHAGVTTIACSHDGYRRLSGGLVHRRTWQHEAGRLRVDDRVTGGADSAVARYHLAPDVSVAVAGDQVGLTLPGGQRLTFLVHQGRLAVEPATWHPEFGLSLQTSCICVSLMEGAASVELRW